jgi:crossover junction endodeoxyribonuclease RuvC
MRGLHILLCPTHMRTKRHRSPSFIGLDLSLTSTGMVVMRDGQISQDANHCGGELRGAERLEFIAKQIQVSIEESTYEGESFAAIEGYTYASMQNLPALAELGGVVKCRLLDMGVPFIIVAPTTLKKFTTGDHHAKKDKMILEVYKRWDYEAENNDMADAYALAAFCAAHHEKPWFALTAFQQDTLKKYLQKRLAEARKKV